MKEINSFERISRSNEDGRGGISGHSNRKSGRSGLDARFKSERRFLSGQASKQASKAAALGPLCTRRGGEPGAGG